MSVQHVVVQGEFQVRVMRRDFDQFRSEVQGRNPPEWLPAVYRVTAVEDTNFVPDDQPFLIARVRVQLVNQTTA